MILEYQRCLGRIRVSMAPVREQPHRTDVERILYARGQEELVTAEELYAAFSALEPEQAAAPAGGNPGAGMAVPAPLGSGKASSGNTFLLTL